MAYIDFISSLHKKTKRDYLARVNDIDYPKAKAANLAKKFDYDYWDGDRRINYGGYKYIENYWDNVIKSLIKHYNLNENAKILDVGCGKGYFLNDILKFLPKAQVYGIDISKYAVEQAKKNVRKNITIGNCNKLPWKNKFFDLVISFNTLHCLHNYDLIDSIKEIERVGKKNKYICVESYRNEEEKANLLYWQVTCEAFCTPKEWEWWFNTAGYTGDFSFIYFE